MKILPNSSSSSRQLELWTHSLEQLTKMNRDVLVEHKRVIREEQLVFDFSFAQQFNECAANVSRAATKEGFKTIKPDNHVEKD
jgi:hypothetical protein